MIIGIDGHMIGDKSGGNERYYINILKHLPIDSNDTVYLFVNPGTDVSDLKSKFRIVEFSSGSAFKRYLFELNRFCKAYHIEVLHTQYFIPFLRSCKVVCTIHDICYEHFEGLFTKRDLFRQKLLIPYAAKKANAIFTVSEFSKKDLVDCYRIDPEKVRITYNAVNNEFRVLSKNELNESELRKKYGIGNCPYVLTVGNLQPRKNLLRLMDAFVKWKKLTNNSSRLVIVGKKAWLYSDIIELSRANSDDIILTDYITTEDLIRLYNAASCFVYPSIFEGFGIPPLEAMACGTPVAVSNTSSLPEVVGDAGIYFDPYCLEEMVNSLDILMRNTEIRTILIKKGLDRKNNFQWAKSATIIMNTYHSLL